MKQCVVYKGNNACCLAILLKREGRGEKATQPEEVGYPHLKEQNEAALHLPGLELVNGGRGLKRGVAGAYWGMPRENTLVE